MDITQTVEILLISVFAGVVGSLLGLGGGIIVTPALTLIFGIDIQYAIGASIISVIATSSGSAIAYIKDGIFVSVCFSKLPQRLVQSPGLSSADCSRPRHSTSFSDFYFFILLST
ncbi:Undefined function [Listeria monocytogenes N53-1]|nr:Undefined function [Listeria monocytogenes]CCQ25074.1 Undefined function [Listeria monocytogenes N53-1]